MAKGTNSLASKRLFQVMNGVLAILQKPGYEFAKRKTGASRIKHGAEAELCSLRRIQKDPV